MFWTIPIGHDFHGFDLIVASSSLWYATSILDKSWEQNTSSNSWFFWTCKTSNFEFRELIKSTLKCSSKSLISTLMSLVLVADLEKEEQTSIEFLSALEIPLEYFKMWFSLLGQQSPNHLPQLTTYFLSL